MAIHINLRASPAATWASVNPVLAQGEIGVTTDTYIFKIGNGTTAWNSLATAPTAAPTQTIPWQSLGDGSDGQVTISSGINTLTRDMFYTNLIINGTGQIYTNGYRIFVNGVLDLTAAPVGAINFNGANGGNASGATGGTGGTTVASGSIGGSNAGGAGATATTGVGGTGGTGLGGNNGGNANPCGAGGIGGSGAGGVSVAGNASSTVNFIRRFETNLIRSGGVVAVTLGGSTGRGGSSGAGDGTNTGGGGGGAGAGGGVVGIWANVILRSSSTPAGVIQANGGSGGAGTTTSTGVTGGGGGGAGGGGGWVYIAYNYLAGPRITNFIQANGGSGGAGGSGFGSAAGVVSGASGAAGGFSGRITLFDIVTQAGQEMFNYNTTNQNPQVAVVNPPVGSVGGAGNPGGTNGLSI